MNNNEKKLLKIFAILLILYVIQSVYMYFKSIIINVDGRNITKPQFDKVFEKNANTSGFAMLGIDIRKDKKGFLYQLVKDNTVEDLIKETLIDEEIEKKHIHAANEGLKKRKLAESISKIVISDAEAKKYYQDHLNNFKHDETVKVSHIFIAANPERIKKEIKSKPENKNLREKELQAKIEQELSTRLEKTKKLLTIVKNNPSLFAKVAKENSEDKTSAQNGGELGFATRGQMSPLIAEVVFNIQPNTISDIVKTHNGYHILIVSDKTKASQDSFEKVKNDIVSILEKQKQDAILDDLAVKLKKQAKIKYVNPEYTPKS